MSQLELWLEHDRDDVPGALGPDSVQRIRADAARWGAQVARQGAQLIANLLDELVGEIVTRAWLERLPGA